MKKGRRSWLREHVKEVIGNEEMTTGEIYSRIQGKKFVWSITPSSLAAYLRCSDVVTKVGTGRYSDGAGGISAEQVIWRRV